MDIFTSLRIRYFVVIVNVFLVISAFLNFASAKDACDKIENLDDKLSCYEKEKEDLSKSRDSFNKQLKDILAQKDSVNAQISSVATKIGDTNSQLISIDNTLKKISSEILEIEKNLNTRIEVLNQKFSLRDSVLKSYYYENSSNDVEFIISEGGNSFSNISVSLMAKEKVNSEIVNTIKILSKEINEYEDNKKQAQKAKSDLEISYKNFLAVKNKLATQKTSLSGTLSTLKNKQEDVQDSLDDINASIEKLSAKQQSILIEKSGDNVSGSIGEYAQPTYSLPNPPYKPAFALMSYGAFTHYNGMSQYGAKGRAEAGQSYKDILKYYYKTGIKDSDSFPKTISVKGVGTLDYQYYLYGIAEMPSDWPIEALKAQAVAARTYAYRSSKPICITEACQVYNASKAKSVPSNWKKAVDDTKGEILDNPETAQFSSTTGGYINNIGWDLKGGAWPGAAYEKVAGSPWFYKAWYTQGYSTSSSTCGRSTPWLSEKEVADLLNAWVVWRKGNSSDKDRISPAVNNCFGGNPYSVSAMKSRADELGESYTSINDVSVDIGSNGRTSKVTFSTDRGNVVIDGDVFKTVANLRSPGYISFKSRMYDIEMKR